MELGGEGIPALDLRKFPEYQFCGRDERGAGEPMSIKGRFERFTRRGRKPTEEHFQEANRQVEHMIARLHKKCRMTAASRWKRTLGGVEREAHLPAADRGQTVQRRSRGVLSGETRPREAGHIAGVHASQADRDLPPEGRGGLRKPRQCRPGEFRRGIKLWSMSRQSSRTTRWRSRTRARSPGRTGGG